MAAVKTVAVKKSKTTTRKKKMSTATCEAEAAVASHSGRPRAVRTKIPLKVREALGEYLGFELPELMSRRDELELKDRWDIVAKILPYVTPKMISNDVNAQIEVDSVDNQLSALAAETAEMGKLPQ